MSNILIIEDEREIVELYKENLESAGFEVQTATDGDTGIALIDEGKWDLLFLDVMLPKKDGMEILKHTVESPLTKGKPVVLLTNIDDEKLKKRGLNLGASKYIVKSEITPDYVVSTAKNILESQNSKELNQNTDSDVTLTE